MRLCAPPNARLEDKKQTTSLAIPAKLPKVWADRTRLAQILINLVSNANKYTPESGIITVGAEKAAQINGTRRRSDGCARLGEGQRHRHQPGGPGEDLPEVLPLRRLKRRAKRPAPAWA